ncbi:DASS family sodium-coupled anion symporter [Bartonella tamiae]|uniref:Divalent anion:Na+ symporter (DASS) family transporter n=1 Tax=Bartonella tamiae Th239 TaxID=1094558 RepID=J0R759_9HYPH|nr:DASS family sodium-coupled anion symporter [Bartonella tamiae]EJF91569.1 divalent anion:Na+ symporter (DASS) family transporter [Bartonella tamiae Th239]EJF92447.1 divalent anion:Na+ symporter (DASS) family transporter [Bartonella tamiae Th307]
MQKVKTYYQKISAFFPFRIVPGILCVIVFCAFYLFPKPDGLTPEAWHFVAIFIATILGIILKVMPIGAMSIIAITVVMVSKVTSSTSSEAVADALGAMNSTLIWLIVISIFVSRGLIKTGLGMRIGFYFIAALGKKTLGIGYGLALCEMFIAPFTPSNTARGGAIMHPIMRSIAHAFQSDPEKGTQGKVGTYLALVNYHANPISSAMFITATAPNPLVVNYIAQATNQNLSLSWSAWALSMLIPGVVAMLVMPLVIYWMSPPQLKTTPNAIKYAKKEIENLGPIQGKEIVMLMTFLIMLLLWAGVPAALFGQRFVFNPTAVAFIGLVILLVCGTLTWDDVIKEKSAWDTLIWFGALVMLANELNKLGIVSWFSDGLMVAIEHSGMSWPFVMAVLILTFLYAHYAFASTTAHISAMMLAFLNVGVHLIPASYINLYMFLMAASSAIMMCLTHYGTGTSPIIFNSGFVSLGRWWGVGFIMSVVNILIFAIIGGIWWKVLGYW